MIKFIYFDVKYLGCGVYKMKILLAGKLIDTYLKYINMHFYVHNILD